MSYEYDYEIRREQVVAQGCLMGFFKAILLLIVIAIFVVGLFAGVAVATISGLLV